MSEEYQEPDPRHDSVVLLIIVLLILAAFVGGAWVGWVNRGKESLPSTAPSAVTLVQTTQSAASGELCGQAWGQVLRGGEWIMDPATGENSVVWYGRRGFCHFDVEGQVIRWRWGQVGDVWYRDPEAWVEALTR